MAPAATEALIVVAHPDDEVVGFAAGLQEWPTAHLAFLTDGAPRDPAYFSTPSASREAYAARRRAEALAAAARLGVGSAAVHFFAAVDMESYRDLPRLERELTALAADQRPGVIWSPAYDGGHPDHDVAAYLAARLARRCAAAHFQFALYCDRDGLEPFTFAAGEAGVERRLSPSQEVFKRGLIAVYASQAAVLGQFACDRERYREAWPHDFGVRPGPAPTLYERWGWPVRAEALIDAFAALEAGCACC
ncbi:MAG: PIG-L family deacetylase [Candidatus Binatia bacterium]